ncbi:hypothetical protein HA466_0261710 [Hirschfeldia incana]|nr:hypothetical protein HA466_0261660 [Hirschfeldia incana]KAJ0236187.1 hypothetical protein HA466_0261710 [Hirschfeldia incana]
MEEMMTVPCNFCEFSSSSSSRYGCISEEEGLDEAAVLRKEVEKLRLLIKRMNGKDECASFTELTELISHLRSVQCIVLSQQNKEKEAEAGRAKKGVLVPCNSTIGSSSKESQEKQSHGSRLLRMKINFERRNTESLQSEFDRLWLVNERMNGRMLEGMTSIDLAYLHSNISCALVALMGQTSGPRMEQMAMQHLEEPISRLAERKRCSSSPLQFRLLLVSRKLRRFHY